MDGKIYQYMLFAVLFTAAMICLSLLMTGCAPIPESRPYVDPDETQVLDKGQWIEESTFLESLADDYKLVHIGMVHSGINQANVYLLIYDANPGGIYSEKAVIVISGDGVAISNVSK